MVDTEALTSGLSSANSYDVISNLLGVSVGAAIVILAIISVWALVWKGFALWKAAQKKSLVWFILLLIVNTVGILEILYIFVFSKMDFGKKNTAMAKPAVHSKKKKK